MFRFQNSGPAPSSRQVVCIPFPIDAPNRKRVASGSFHLRPQVLVLCTLVIPSRLPMRKMLVCCSIAILTALPISSTAQTQQDPPQRPTFQERLSRLVNPPPGVWTTEQLATMARLRDAALQDPYALDQLRHLTDNIGPRISGSPQAQHAVEYVAAQMRALGAEVQLERTMVPHWVRGLETSELISWPGQTPGTTQKIVLTALGGSGATPGDGLQAEVVVVNSFEELRQLPADSIKGKILLFNERFDKKLAMQGNGGAAYGKAVVYRGAAPSLGKSFGAAAVLVRSVGGADYRLPPTGATLSGAQTPRIPSAPATPEHADLLANLTSQGPVRMRLTLTPQTLPPVESYNVIADWKGAEHPEQVVIVSGHLDSWDLATGAIDDGAGVVVSMQAIHLVRQLHLKPKRTIRVIAWMNEENGSRGSKQYAKDHASEFANHFAVNETDGGAGHPIGLNLKTKPEVKKMFEPIAKILEEIGAGSLNLSEHVGADTEPMEKAGVPAFSPMEDSRFYFNYHHTPADTLDKIVPRELQENAAVVTVAAYAFANAEQSLPR